MKGNSGIWWLIGIAGGVWALSVWAKGSASSPTAAPVYTYTIGPDGIARDQNGVPRDPATGKQLFMGA